MPRLIHQKGLEQFVVGYLTKLPRYGNNAVEKKFLRKSIALIQDFFGYPCCSGGTTVSFVTPLDNELTNTIKAIIQPGLVIRRPFRKSLEEILALINEKLYGCCTTELTVIFDNGTGSFGNIPVLPIDAQVQIYDAFTDALLFQTSTTGAASGQTFLIPNKYLDTVPVRICVNSLVAPGGTGYVVSGTDHVPLVTVPTGHTGQVCQAQPYAIGKTTYVIWSHT
jgi:hypothetical protein